MAKVMPMAAVMRNPEKLIWTLWHVPARCLMVMGPWIAGQDWDMFLVAEYLFHQVSKK
jgi:hypothetical protein